MNPDKTSKAKLIAGFLWTVSMSSAAFAGAPVRTVALSGEQAPGLPAGVEFDAFGGPEINANGQVVFSATVSGPGFISGLADNAIFSDRSGSLDVEANIGETVAGAMSPVWYLTFQEPTLNDNAQIAFQSLIGGVGVTTDNDMVLIADDGSGAFGLVARRGDQPAGVATTAEYRSFSGFRFSTDDRVLWTGSMEGTGIDNSNDVGIWTGFPGSTSLVIRESDSAPGIAGADIGASSLLSDPTLGDTGHCAFHTQLTGPTVTPDDDAVIYAGTVGMPTPLIRKGDQAPGLPAGTIISGFLESTSNAGGDVAFRAVISGGSVDASNNVAIFARRERVGPDLHLVARTGDEVPEIPGVFFESFPSIEIQAQGLVVFAATLNGPGVDSTNDECIAQEFNGALSVIAREGDRAPGTPDGVHFDGQFIGGTFGLFSICMTESGHLLFNANIAGPGIDASNRFGVWQFGPDVGLRLIARTGDEIEVAPGDSRVVNMISHYGKTGGSDGLPSSLSESGAFAFRANFTDGSQGIFVTKDTDGDGVVDVFDNCLNTDNPHLNDFDNDGFGDACDGCPENPNKTEPGACGCGAPDIDSDGDGTLDCFDECPNDPNKTELGICGCGTPDVDSDGDSILDCIDIDPTAPNPDGSNNNGDGVGDTQPEIEQCCGGGMPTMMPLMLLGWKCRRRRTGANGRARSSN